MLAAMAGRDIEAIVHFVGSVQEEFSIRGLVTAAFAINPETFVKFRTLDELRVQSIVAAVT